MCIESTAERVLTVNGIVNALNVRIQALDAREAGIYLIHSLSNALVSDIKRQKSTGEGKDGQQQRDQEMISKLRAVSEELLLVSTPPAASSAPAFIALMTEVLTLQLWKTITSLDADFVNLTILGRTNHVSTTTPKTIRRRSFGPLVDLASSPKPTQTSFRIDPLPSPLSPASITSSHSEAGPPDMRQAIDVFTKGPSEVTANLLQQIELYLAEHPRQTIESHQTPSVRILQMVLTGQNEELADRFQASSVLLSHQKAAKTCDRITLTLSIPTDGYKDMLSCDLMARLNHSRRSSRCIRQQTKPA